MKTKKPDSPGMWWSPRGGRWCFIYPCAYDRIFAVVMDRYGSIKGEFSKLEIGTGYIKIDCKEIKGSIGEFKLSIPGENHGRRVE